MTVVSNEIYIINNQLTFILTETKVIVKTPHQTNLVTYYAGNYKKQLLTLKDKIRNGEVQSITELIEYNKPRAVGMQIQGLILVPTRIERYV